MRLSELVALLSDDLQKKGDTDIVSLGVTVTGTDGLKYRLDAVIASVADMEVIRDPNIVSGMACIAADYQGLHEIFV